MVYITKRKGNNMFNISTLSTTEKRDLIKELRASINVDRSVARSVKMLARADKAQARADKKAARIAALQAKLDALLNPVGAKAVKANRKPSKAIVTKTA
jgi:hypothetical protein